jgi:hypothetical protein
MRIGLDFDGVLHDAKHPIPGRRMGPPMPGALEGVDALLLAKHTLTVCTARRGAEDGHVAAWLAFYGFPVALMPVTSRKPDVDLLVDDKALRFTSWPLVLPK